MAGLRTQSFALTILFMNNSMNTQTVSPATAAKLAAAGFPQPAPAPGQWWGDEKLLVLIWRKWESSSVDYYTVTILDGTIEPAIEYYFDAEDFTGLVFLPTAMQIMAELYGYNIGLGDDDLYHVTSIMMGEEDEDGNDAYSGGISESSHEHPAEAAALAWLEINKG